MIPLINFALTVMISEKLVSMEAKDLGYKKYADEDLFQKN